MLNAIRAIRKGRHHGSALTTLIIADLAVCRTALLDDQLPANQLPTHGAIAAHYLRGWFVVDLASCLPWDNIAAAASSRLGDDAVASVSGVGRTAGPAASCWCRFCNYSS